MPEPITILCIALALIVVGFFAWREIKLSEAARAAKAARDAKLTPFFAALRQEGILGTTGLTLRFEIQGVSRQTPLIMAESDAKTLRFVAPYGCERVGRSEPTGWGDWSWTDLYFNPTDCPSCGGPNVTVYRFRSYRFDHGDGWGPDPVASVCLDCHVPRGEEGMDDEDIVLIHRCREIARRVSMGAPACDGPYRSAARTESPTAP